MIRKEKSQLPALYLRFGNGCVPDDSPDAQAVHTLASALGRKWAPHLRVAGVRVPQESALDPDAACATLDVDWRDVERHFLSEFP